MQSKINPSNRPNAGLQRPLINPASKSLPSIQENEVLKALALQVGSTSKAIERIRNIQANIFNDKNEFA